MSIDAIEQQGFIEVTDGLAGLPAAYRTMLNEPSLAALVVRNAFTPEQCDQLQLLSQAAFYTDTSADQIETGVFELLPRVPELSQISCEWLGSTAISQANRLRTYANLPLSIAARGSGSIEPHYDYDYERVVRRHLRVAGVFTGSVRTDQHYDVARIFTVMRPRLATLVVGRPGRNDLRAPLRHSAPIEGVTVSIDQHPGDLVGFANEPIAGKHGTIELKKGREYQTQSVVLSQFIDVA